MKKILSFLVMAGFLAACGPSAEEKAAAEKAAQDSIAAAIQKHMEDSLATVQALEKAAQDSINAAMEKARADSLQQALEAAKKKPASKPKTNEQKIEENKKELQKQKG